MSGGPRMARGVGHEPHARPASVTDPEPEIALPPAAVEAAPAVRRARRRLPPQAAVEAAPAERRVRRRLPRAISDLDAEAADRSAWESFAALSLIAAVGLVSVASSYALTAGGFAVGEPLLWIGMLIIAGPITIRLASSNAGIRERLGLVTVLGVLLQLVHVLRSPNGFTNYDALLHDRTLVDILTSGRLLQFNPILEISPHFPALETITAGVAQVSGASPFASAMIVLVLIRILLSLGLFAMYREASSSARVAGLATAVYMLNPQLVFFDSQFAYETLALAFVPAILLVTARWASGLPSARIGLPLVILAATLIITHHVTIVVTALMLVAWLVVALLRYHRDTYSMRRIASSALLLTAAAVFAIAAVGSLLVSYLGPPLLGAVNELTRLITTGVGRAPFQSATGSVAPIWERLVGLTQAGLLALAIPLGGIPLLRTLRHNSLAILLGVLACGYPLSVIARLTPTGSEAAGRSLAFISMGLGFVVSLAIVYAAETWAMLTGAVQNALRRLVQISSGSASMTARVHRGLRPLTGRVTASLHVGARVVFAGGVGVLAIGGIVIGSAPATRFPGPYLVEADSRSIDQQSLTAAEWANQVLGPNQHVAADRDNRLLMGSIGHEDVIFYSSVGVQTWQIFLTPVVGPNEISRATAAGIRYIVIDRRLSDSLPLVPFYYEEGEIFTGNHTVPIPATTLGKWDNVPDVDRVYDSGDIQVYDLARLDGAS